MSDVINLKDFLRAKSERAFAAADTGEGFFPTHGLAAVCIETTAPPVRESWFSRLINYGFSRENAEGLFRLTRRTTLSSIIDECAETLGPDATITLLEEQIGRVILAKVKKGD
jgi:hypothetical protein